MTWKQKNKTQWELKIGDDAKLVLSDWSGDGIPSWDMMTEEAQKTGNPNLWHVMLIGHIDHSTVDWTATFKATDLVDAGHEAQDLVFKHIDNLLMAVAEAVAT